MKGMRPVLGLVVVGVGFLAFGVYEEKYPPTCDLGPGVKVEQHVVGYLVTTDLEDEAPRTIVVRVRGKGGTVPRGLREVSGIAHRDLRNAMIVKLAKGRRFDRMEVPPPSRPWVQQLVVPAVQTVPMETGYRPRRHYLENFQGRVLIVFVEQA